MNSSFCDSVKKGVTGGWWVFALLVLLLLVGSAHAHTFTIQSTRYALSENATKPMVLGWGHYLPLDDGIHGRKIKFLKAIAPDGEEKEILPEMERGLHSYLVAYDKAGTWALTGDTNPGYYTVYIDKNGKEHHVIKPKTKIKRAVTFKLSRYTSQSSKAYVHCGKTTEQYQALTGLDLELAPGKNPSQLKPGEALSLKAYYKGQPYNGKGKWDATFTGYSRKANAWYISDQRSEGGRFTVTPDREGVWVVRYQFSREATAEESIDCDEFTHKTTLVFQVR